MSTERVLVVAILAPDDPDERRRALEEVRDLAQSALDQIDDDLNEEAP